MKPVEAYVICTSPRSGSTLLCDLLGATGVAGNPGSWFHRPSLHEWARGLGVAEDEECGVTYISKLFGAARQRGRGTSNVFGLRLQRHSFDFFIETLRRLRPTETSDVASFERSFGSTRFIHLSRHDKVEQAISYVRAQQTGLWHVAADGTELDRTVAPREPRFDRAAIAAQVETFAEFDRLWAAWFGQQRIEPLRISYAQLADDPVAVTRDVLAYLGLDTTRADAVTPGLSKMADATTDEWVTRFRHQQEGEE